MMINYPSAGHSPGEDRFKNQSAARLHLRYSTILVLLYLICSGGYTRAQTCGCSHLGPELVNNPHFSNTCVLPTAPNPATNYGSDYTPQKCATAPSGPGFFTEGPSAASLLGTWCGSENTGDGVGMLIFDGQTKGQGNKRAWYQTNVIVSAGQTYRFEANVMNICPGCTGGSEPVFEMQVDDGSSTYTLLPTLATSALGSCTWGNMCRTWKSTISGAVTIQIIVLEPTVSGNSGNDGAIDDVSFRKIVTPDPFFTYTQQCNIFQFHANYQDGGVTNVWTFDDPGSGTNNTSSAINPTHTFSAPGSYNVIHKVVDPLCGTGIGSIRVTVGAVGGCCCPTSGKELVFNPHFSNTCVLPSVPDPNTNYGSDYTPDNCHTLPTGTSHFTEGPSAHNLLGNWCGTDHTGDNIGMLIFDGQQNGQGDKRAWYQNVTVTAGTVYHFEAWVINICSNCTSGSEPAFMLQVNDGTNTTTLASVSTATVGTCTWTKLCGVYAPTTGGTITIQITVPAPATTGSSGNDGAIDDISFQAVAGPSSGFTFAPPICNDPVSFTSADAGDTHSWDFGDNTTADPSVNPIHQFLNPGSYKVAHTVTNSCGSTTTIQQVTITGCCTCTGIGNNLVTDGDFSMTCNYTQYSSDLLPIGCPNGATAPNQYTETNNAHIIRPNYCGMDHTTATGSTNFLLADGRNPGMPDAKAWYQTGNNNNHTGYPVAPGTSYCYSAFVINVDNMHPINPTVKLVISAGGQRYTVAEIDNLPVNNSSNSAESGCCGWTKICGCWTVPANVFVVDTLSIVIVSKGCEVGNDLGIDDIQFSESLPGTCNSPCSKGGNMPNIINPMGKQVPGVKTDPSLGLHGADVADNMTVSPVPANQGTEVKVNYAAARDISVRLKVYDLQGKVVYSTRQSLRKGSNDIMIKTDRLKPGTYMIKTESETGTQTGNLVIE